VLDFKIARSAEKLYIIVENIKNVQYYGDFVEKTRAKLIQYLWLKYNLA